MGVTKVVLDRDAVGKTFSWGTTGAGGESLLTLHKGTQPTSFVSLDVKASANVDGNMVIGGTLTVAGTIDTQSSTNTRILDKTITVNGGGTSAGAGGSGVIVEGDGAVPLADILYDTNFPTKFKAGPAGAEIELIGATGTQTMTGKTMVAASNTINDTGAALGDLFKFDGTRFVKFAKGSALQVLRVNTGGTDLEWTAAYATYERWTTVTGTQDDVNKTFTLGNALDADTEIVVVNGVIRDSGPTNDYVLTGTSLVFQSGFIAPSPTDKIKVRGRW